MKANPFSTDALQGIEALPDETRFFLVDGLFDACSRLNLLGWHHHC
jgi:hypothetical protein